MAQKRERKKTLQPQKISKAPDDQLKSIPGSDVEEEPRIFKIAQRGSEKSVNRRSFLKGLAGVITGAAIGKFLTGCAESDYSVNAAGDRCTCHVVCNCDVEEEFEKDVYSAHWSQQLRSGSCICDAVCTCNTVCTCNCVSETQDADWRSRRSGGSCTCDQVCTCNTVCTCNSMGGGGGGGGGHYWYPN